MNRAVDHIDEMMTSPEKWIDVMETVVDSMFVENASSHNITQFVEDVLYRITQTIQLNEDTLTATSKIQAHRDSLKLLQLPALLLGVSGTVLERNPLFDTHCLNISSIKIASSIWKRIDCNAVAPINKVNWTH